jgi:hypothetical protein
MTDNGGHFNLNRHALILRFDLTYMVTIKVPVNLLDLKKDESNPPHHEGVNVSNPKSGQTLGSGIYNQNSSTLPR